MKHNHSCQCKHTHVEYCSTCRVVHCADCNMEWAQKVSSYPSTYPWYQAFGSQLIGNQTTRLADGSQATLTCSHTQEK